MRNLALMAAMVLLITTKIFAQTVKPYWAIAGKNTEFSLVEMSAKEARWNVSAYNVVFGYREVFMIVDKIDDTYYAIDPLGRLLYLKGDLYPVIYSQDVTPGIVGVTSAITLQDGGKIKAGLFLWCVEIDVENEKAKIQIGDKETISVPLSKLTIQRQTYGSGLEKASFRKIAK